MNVADGHPVPPSNAAAISDPYYLQALLLCCHVTRTSRVLVVSDRPERAKSLFPLFDVPWTFRHAGTETEDKSPDIDAGRFDVVVWESSRPARVDTIQAALASLRGRGAFLLLDWSASMTQALRGLAWSLGGTRRDTHLSREVEELIYAAGLTRQTTYFVEPSLLRPRHLVERGFRSEIPGRSHSAWKRWLLQKGAFYLQPRHKVVMANASKAASPVGLAVERTFSKAPSTAGSARAAEPTVRQYYLSGTNVFVLNVSSPGDDPLYLRFPLHETATSRMTRLFEVLTQLARIGYRYAPAPVHRGEVGGFAFFAEKALPGKNIQWELGRMPVKSFERHFEQGLGGLEELHLLHGETRLFDEALFERYLTPRLESLGECLRASNRYDADNFCTRLAEFLFDEFSGKIVRLGYCHGDAKLANSLFTDAKLSGWIDWDMATDDGLCCFDTAALYCNSVMQREGGSVAELLAMAPENSAGLISALQSYADRMGTSAIDSFTAAVLYWLDRVARQWSFKRVTPQWSAKFVTPAVAEFQRRRPRSVISRSAEIR